MLSPVYPVAREHLFGGTTNFSGTTPFGDHCTFRWGSRGNTDGIYVSTQPAPKRLNPPDVAFHCRPTRNPSTCCRTTLTRDRGTRARRRHRRPVWTACCSSLSLFNCGGTKQVEEGRWNSGSTGRSAGVSGVEGTVGRWSRQASAEPQHLICPWFPCTIEYHMQQTS